MIRCREGLDIVCEKAVKLEKTQKFTRSENGIPELLFGNPAAEESPYLLRSFPPFCRGAEVVNPQRKMVRMSLCTSHHLR